MSGLISKAKEFREYITPVRTESAFLNKGVLTPDEFVAAGDQLVFKCPTWSWAAGNPSNAKRYLPPDKQYLITRHVPCRRRVNTLDKDYLGDTEIAGLADYPNDEGWVEPNVLTESTREGECGPGVVVTSHYGGGDDGGGEEMMELAKAVAYPADGATGGGGAADGTNNPETVAALAVNLGAMALMDDEHFLASKGGGKGGKEKREGDDGEAAGGGGSGGGSGGGDDNEEDDFPDLDTYVEDNVEQPDEATLNPPLMYVRAEEPADDDTAGGSGGGGGGGGGGYAEGGSDSNILHTRSYDLSMTYDKYYQTPRMWLMGYREGSQSQVLSGEDMFEDIMQDYHNQTVTIEPHPHHSDQRQASIHPCKHANVMKNMISNMEKGGGTARVDQYLFIFLKFIQSVVPTIDYDHTMAVTLDGR